MSDEVSVEAQQAVVEKQTRPTATDGGPGAKFNWSMLHKIVLACQYATLMASEAGECSLDVALPNAQIDPTTVLG